MVMQRIEGALGRGFEKVGLISPGALRPKVMEALESYRAQGQDAVTYDQIGRRMRQLHPARGWFPMSNGNLAGALWLMKEKGEVTIKVIKHRDETCVHEIPVYSLTEKPQVP